MPETKSYLKGKFRVTKTCSPYFRIKETFSFIQNTMTATSTIQEGKYSGTLKRSYLQSNKPWYPAA
jgi:hypothetical protein